MILGVDPGLQRTGYAFISAGASEYESAQLLEAGVIRLASTEPVEQRLVALQTHLTELLKRHPASAAALEDLYAHYKHPRTAILMGHARGVIMATCAAQGCAVTAVPATQAKKLLTGSGHATKAQMQRAVQTTLGLPALPEPNDVADAIAIALCGRRLIVAERLRQRERSA